MKAQDAIYDSLDFKSGSLFDASISPIATNQQEWLNKGEWLSAAKKAGATKIFFVEDNPIVVFAECSAAPWEWLEVWKRMWSLARPRLLLLVTGDTVTVIDLAKKPILEDINDSDNARRAAALETLTVANVALQEAQQFHRDNIESGKTFEDHRFGGIDQRADKALIADLKTVRQALINSGLKGEKLGYAHALIGRSIFVRYLEDRKIIDRSYFEKLAKTGKEKSDLSKLLDDRGTTDLTEFETFYPRILGSKTFTYTLFRQLATDFNGDMFPDVANEQENVQQQHLSLVRDMLYANVGEQQKLFFQSYRFDIVPLDLISSIYEEFYHSQATEKELKSKARQDGAYYTPPVLAEFLLSRVLTEEVLATKPIVLDPACGSGIFLVEAFRRILRYERKQLGRSFTYQELKGILTSQISGIEVNPEAARITAFSLYLAMLHQLDPPSILEQMKVGNRLPSLLVSEKVGGNHFNRIWAGNAFDIKQIESQPVLSQQFGKGSADVVVGNPPWGSPGDKKASTETKAREALMLEWCNLNKRAIGDKEPSQAFLWRALDFLREGGVAGMLVTASVLLKLDGKPEKVGSKSKNHNSETKEQFRATWLKETRLIEVFNFTHVRRFFFKGAIAPFVQITFQKATQGDDAVAYWVAKQVAGIGATQAVLFSKYDRAWIRNEYLSSNVLWKRLYFGRHADGIFLNQISHNPASKPLSALLSKDGDGVGFQKANQKNEADWLLKYDMLDNESFCRYGQLKIDLKPPLKVRTRGKNEAFYYGSRILVIESLEQKDETFGRITARYESDPFCFNHSIHVLKLKSVEEEDYLVLLGILWSSFARYFFFMTSSNWGVWYDKVLITERGTLPVVLGGGTEKQQEIVEIVNKLRAYDPPVRSLQEINGLPPEVIATERKRLEEALDEAIFELYGFTEQEKDLIRDCCNVTLPFLYQPFDANGPAVAPSFDGKDTSFLEAYAKVFARRWNPYFSEATQVRAEAHIGLHGNMVAVEFFPADAADDWDLKPKDKSWETILEEIGQSLQTPVGTSRMIQDGILYVVSDKSIIIVKRNEKRFWTKSLAREDAEATFVKRVLQRPTHTKEAE